MSLITVQRTRDSPLILLRLLSFHLLFLEGFLWEWAVKAFGMTDGIFLNVKKNHYVQTTHPAKKKKSLICQ